MTSSQTKYTKIPPQTGGSSYVLTENSPETDIIPIHFVRNRSRINNIFTSGHFVLCLF
jgi:hypothetical protein